MSLASLQRGFSAWLVDPAEPVECHVGTAAGHGLAVYAHAYRAQLIDCLRDTHARTHFWLGDDAFDAAARAHIDDHPPTGWTLGRYGEGFTATLRKEHPDDPEIAELAWLDWSLRRAFDGADADPIDRATLAGIDWDKAVFRFVPTLTTTLFATNAAAIWAALAEGSPVPDAEWLDEPACIRVWRNDLSPQYRTIGVYEARALELARARGCFGHICEMLTALLGDEEGAAEAARILQAWLGEGVLAAIDQPYR